MSPVLQAASFPLNHQGNPSSVIEIEKKKTKQGLVGRMTELEVRDSMNG